MGDKKIFRSMFHFEDETEFIGIYQTAPLNLDSDEWNNADVFGELEQIQEELSQKSPIEIIGNPNIPEGVTAFKRGNRMYLYYSEDNKVIDLGELPNFNKLLEPMIPLPKEK